MLIVLSRPTDGMERQYNEWYDAVHLPEVCELEGFDSAVRYRLAPTQLPGRLQPAQQYLAIYGISSEIEVALTALDAAVSSERIKFDPSLDRDATRAWAFERLP